MSQSTTFFIVSDVCFHGGWIVGQFVAPQLQVLHARDPDGLLEPEHLLKTVKHSKEYDL